VSLKAFFLNVLSPRESPHTESEAVKILEVGKDLLYRVERGLG
jgi:hypothetical protein